MDVESKRQATVEYAFSPPESFAARPFGLTILLDYKDEVFYPYCKHYYSTTAVNKLLLTDWPCIDILIAVVGKRVFSLSRVQKSSLKTIFRYLSDLYCQILFLIQE